MKHVVFLAVAALALAGCQNREPLAADFGNSVNANIAAQVVNPAPASRGPNDGDGTRMANAIDRYRTNKVYKPTSPLQGGRILLEPKQ